MQCHVCSTVQRSRQWQCLIPVLRSTWQPMLSVPPEWAQAKAEIMASAMAAKVFFIFISQRCLKRQAMTDHIDGLRAGCCGKSGGILLSALSDFVGWVYGTQSRVVAAQSLLSFDRAAQTICHNLPVCVSSIYWSLEYGEICPNTYLPPAADSTLLCWLIS